MNNVRGEDPSIIRITPSYLPEKDFAGGVCFKPRDDGAVIDVLVIHSCHVPDSVRSAKRELIEVKSHNDAAKLLRLKWKESGNPDYENAALLALLEGRYGASGLQKFSVDGIKVMFEFYGVSAHYVIDREGEIFELVKPELLAFHAGKSKLPSDGRESVNGFSIGIELLADESSGYTAPQMAALIALSKKLKTQFPIKTFVRHSDIAPDKKTDPWNFDWEGYLVQVKDS